MLEIPEVRVGEPSVCGNVAVFPLFTGLPLFPASEGNFDYVLAHEAMAAGTVVVREVSEEGSVGTLLVDNGGDQPVLFVDGQELKGAKQNRAVCSSILIAGKSRTRIPVCCVQRRRWTYSSTRQFSSGSCCPPTLRHVLKQGMQGHARRLGSQAAVWQEIRRKHRATRTSSANENMSDALDSHREAVDEVLGRLRYPKGASGMAVAIGGKVVSVDIFDKAVTLEKLWDRLVQGVAIDALEGTDDDGHQASALDISVKLYMVNDVRWRQVEPIVGLGETYSARGKDETLATALAKDHMLVHLSLSMAMCYR
jgi:hypothetical protein